MNHRRHFPSVLFLLAFALGVTGVSRVHLAAADNARDIMQEAQTRATSKAERYEGLLESFGSDGKKTEKRWIFERLGSHGQSKSKIRFTTPAEVKGVALLIVNHPDKASDQWMWTPAIERDRRIALQDRSTRFFGTDFSFEDLEERDVDQYDYTLLEDQTIEGVACWQVQSTARSAKSSQYTRSIVWISKANYATVRVDSYVKEQVVRRLINSDIRNIQGIWTPRVSTMTDLRRNSRTQLTLENVQYNVPLNESDFTLQALRR